VVSAEWHAQPRVGRKSWAGEQSARVVDGSLPWSGRAHPDRSTAVAGTACGRHEPSALHGWHREGL